MSEGVVTKESETLAEGHAERPGAERDKATWETPRMEDVSEQVMAQPYIRFT